MTKDKARKILAVMDKERVPDRMIDSFLRNWERIPENCLSESMHLFDFMAYFNACNQVKNNTPFYNQN